MTGRVASGRGGGRLRLFFAALAVVTFAALAAVAWPWAQGILAAPPSEDFTLAALEVKGLRLLNGDDILEASGLAVGDNIFRVDLNAVALRLDSLVWVKRARIVRKPPDRLAITILERQRFAWVELDGRILGIDAEGVLLPGAELEREEREILDLPVLRGAVIGVPNLDSPAAMPGQILADSSLALVLEWWAEAAALEPAFSRNFSEIRPLGADAVRLFMVGDGLEVRMPMDRVQERLGVLEELMGRVYRECPDPSYVDLRYEGQVVVGNGSTNRKEG
ncbi:MAG: hypothetical protein CME15_00845 [Gemmatimonadetes bacterium]|nr:hypothetical protein [Gemmatimonadota bacterium]